MPQISIVAPLYNESESSPHLIERLNAVMNNSPVDIEVLLIDDRSKDTTPQLMHQIAFADKRYHSLFISRNHGHQLALSAGITAAKGTEAHFIIDGDLHAPPELLPDFYAKLKEGFVKRTGYFLFYRLLKSISYVGIPLDSGDFSLVSRRVVEIMKKMPEESRYLRGMRTWIGFKQIGFGYERDERVAGTSKYSFKQLFRLAYNGIFNFIEFPIKFMTTTGALAITIALIYFIIVVAKKVFFTQVIEGFTAMLFVVILFSGVQLLALDIIGEYVLRIFFQSKNRPLFIVESEIEKGEYI